MKLQSAVQKPVYGPNLFATGLDEMAHTLHPTPVLFSLHLSLGRGGFMGSAGAACVIRHRPKRITSK